MSHADRDGHAGRDVDHAAGARDAAAPRVGRAPVATGRSDVRGVGDLDQAHRVQHRFQALHARAVLAFPPLHSLISTASRICVRILLLLMLTTASGLFVTHQ